MAANGEPIRIRMWRAAREDVSARGNPLDELRFAVGWLAAELEKRDKVIEELRAEMARRVEVPEKP